jgi:hypothetical protein
LTTATLSKKKAAYLEACANAPTYTRPVQHILVNDKIYAEPYAATSYRTLQGLCKSKGLRAIGKRDVLVQRLLRHESGKCHDSDYNKTKAVTTGIPYRTLQAMCKAKGLRAVGKREILEQRLALTEQ